jgi:transposase
VDLVDVVIGIDPHKHSSTTAALDRSGRLLQVARFPASRDGYRALRQWAARWPARSFAVEGASGLGRPVAQQLLGYGETVVDVPAKLAARVRLLSSGHNRKTDPDDAVATARAAVQADVLQPVTAEDHSTVLRLLSERRDQLVAQRTRTINRLHVLLTDLIPAGSGPQLTADRAAQLLRRCAPAPPPAPAACAASWPATWFATCAGWTASWPTCSVGSPERSNRPRQPCLNCLECDPS